jgi:HK97 family phage prohead protease
MSSKDYIKSIDGAERRYAVSDMRVEKRADSEGKENFTVEGYAALFEKPTVIGGWFEEVVEKGFFDDVLSDDIRCLFNHDANQILARCYKGKGTLEVGIDEKGLWYRFITPDRQYALDLADAIDKGDVSESSFSFVPKEEEWVKREGKMDLRRLIKCKILYDVSPVTFAAYPDTTVAKRSRDAFMEIRENIPNDKELSLMEAQLIINQNL